MSVLCLSLGCILLAGILGEPCIAQEPAEATSEFQTPSISRAMARIISDVPSQEWGPLLQQRLAELPASKRYEYLHDRILPKYPRGTVRLTVDFPPTQPAPGDTDSDVTEGRAAQAEQRSADDAAVICPARDLIRLASASQRLTELQRQLEQLTPSDLNNAKNRVAMLTLIHRQRNDLKLTLASLDEFAELSAAEQPDDSRHRAAELVLFEALQDLPEAREVLTEIVERVVTRHKRSYRQDAWCRQFRSRRQILASRDAGHRSEIRSGRTQTLLTETEAESAQWFSCSTVSAYTRGLGIAPSVWKIHDGVAENLVSHGDDYLYFQSPLQGTYQIECDVSAFNWSETRLLVGGTWLNANHDHEHYDVGDLRTILTRGTISPRLSTIRDRLHYRTVVDSQRAVTSINGRVIHVQPLPEHPDPWVAIRSGAMQEGHASNVRITGEPTIPESVSLTSAPQLSGWISYDGASVGSAGSQWRPLLSDNGTPLGICSAGALQHASATFELIRRAQPRAIREALLYYHRPVLEDGVIEYEFYYRSGQLNVHPALDRLCLMIQPSGVGIHWLTDGKYDRTELRPDNFTDAVEWRRGPSVVPLSSDAWNKAQVAVVGDVLRLTVNGVLVFERPLEPENERRFGFFHNAELEDVLVRNVRWSGQWPRQLPATSQQQLVQPVAEFLEQNIDHLKASYHHDFQEGDRHMGQIHGTSGANFLPVPEGLKAEIAWTGGYRNATLAPDVQIFGDFDIVAEYTDFETEPTRPGSSSLMLTAILQNSSADEFTVTRRHVFEGPERERQILQCVAVRNLPEGSRRDYFVTQTLEDRSGRLRLSRRGNRMYYLTAEGDSPSFRLWGTRECSTDPVDIDGLRLLAQIYEPGRTSVVWKSLAVRAVQLAGSVMGADDLRLQTVNQRREQLQARKGYSFAESAPPDDELLRWTDLRPWSPDGHGLSIIAPGKSHWTSAGIGTRYWLAGDFDIRVELDVIRLADSLPNDRTVVMLQADLADDLDSQVSALFALGQGGGSEFDSQHRTRKSDGTFGYKNQGRSSAQSLAALRLIRHGTLFTIIGQEQGQPERIIRQFHASDAPVSQAKLLVHTGGEGRSSEVLLKQMEIRSSAEIPAVSR